MTQIHSPETVNSNTKFVAAEIQRILAGKLFDTYQLQFLPSQTIIVSKNTGIILNVESTNPNDLDPSQMSSGNTIDLRHLTILPGFVDTHVHCKCLFCGISTDVEFLTGSFPAFLRGNIMGRPDYKREPCGENRPGHRPCTQNPFVWLHNRKVCFESSILSFNGLSNEQGSWNRRR